MTTGTNCTYVCCSTASSQSTPLTHLYKPPLTKNQQSSSIPDMDQNQTQDKKEGDDVVTIETKPQANECQERQGSQPKTLDQRFTEIAEYQSTLGRSATHMVSVRTKLCVFCDFHERMTAADDRHWAECVFRMCCQCDRCSRHRVTLKKRKGVRREKRQQDRVARRKHFPHLAEAIRLLPTPTPQQRPARKLHRPWEDATQ